MAKHDTSYLKQRNRAWWFKIKIPAVIRDCYEGREHVEISLKTRDLDEANLRKLPLLAKYQREFDRLRQVDPANREAAKLRLRLRQLQDRDDDSAETERDVIFDIVAERAQEMVDRHGVPEARAGQWATLATTDKATLSEALDQWLDSAEYSKQTAQQHRHAVGELKTFLGGDVLPSMVTDQTASGYVREELQKVDASYNTKRRKLNSLYAFWKWMGQHHIVPRGLNPWGGFTLQKGRKGEGKSKRGYTDAELIDLFGQRPDYPCLADIMVIGLFTGARLDEICNLQTQDVEKRGQAYVLRITKSKTEAGIRSIVVCHAFVMGVLKRLKEAHETGSLFPELRGGGYDDRLSWAVSKAFGRFRDKRGLSRATDFHSFRRTVITILENRAVHPGHTASFVGHEGKTIGHDVYLDGLWFKTLRDVAAKIVYRKPVEKVVAEFCTLPSF